MARAIAQGTLIVDVENPRDHAEDRHNTVDDRPYGGGPGMVMKVEPMVRADRSVEAARGWPGADGVSVAAGRAAASSARSRRWRAKSGSSSLRGAMKVSTSASIDASVDEQISLGDFVLTGGELPVMVVHRCGRPLSSRHARQRGVGRGGVVSCGCCSTGHTTPVLSTYWVGRYRRCC